MSALNINSYLTVMIRVTDAVWNEQVLAGQSDTFTKIQLMIEIVVGY